MKVAHLALFLNNTKENANLRFRQNLEDLIYLCRSRDFGDSVRIITFFKFKMLGIVAALFHNMSVFHLKTVLFMKEVTVIFFCFRVLPEKPKQLNVQGVEVEVG